MEKMHLRVGIKTGESPVKTSLEGIHSLVCDCGCGLLCCNLHEAGKEKEGGGNGI